MTLRGTLTEARLWRKALDLGAVGARINGSESGLVAWWRLAEGRGNLTADAKGTAPATLRGGVSWVKTPDPTGSPFQVYRDGVPVVTTPVPAATYAPTSDGFTLGGTGTDRFTGQLEELRIWRTRRTTEQLQDNLFRRIEGEQSDLVAYYTFDGEPGARLTDQGPRGNTLAVVAGSYQPSTAPVGADVPQVRNAVAGLTNLYTARVADATGVAEYADLQRAADGVRARRLQALLRPGRRRGPLAAHHRVQGGRPGRRVGGAGPVRPPARRVHRRRTAGAQREPHRQRRRLHRGQLGDDHRGVEHQVHLLQLPHGGHRRLPRGLGEDLGEVDDPRGPRRRR